jgi:hypothetical protein
VFFKARIPPFTAGVKPTTALRSTVGCGPNTSRLQIFLATTGQVSIDVLMEYVEDQ